MRRFLSRTRYGDAASGSPLARRLRRLSAFERKEEARAFLNAFHDAAGAGRGQRQARWAEVRRQIDRSGSYTHTPEELAYGARLAWRNTGRCIGRLNWESLDVIDCRHITDPEAMQAQILHHLDSAFGDGRIRSVISIFAPATGNTLPAWIESPQIAQYACHQRADGALLGDRQNVEATRIALSMGWTPPPTLGRFDLLPYLIRDAADRRHLCRLPEGAVREVAIRHPQLDGLTALGLKWYAVPLVSNMILTIGGVDYPCAPFNGFYMGTEIASRNFADARRYDLLADVAKALDLPMDASSQGLWRDTALTELNRAVLESFKAAGVTMVDHHTASNQFMTFHAREQAQGRRVAADWRWIVPPQAAAACDVFHLRMRNFHPVPNFYRDRGSDGLRLMPWYGDRHRSRVSMWADRLIRRWKIWKRMPW
jgi:nitric-oxide synthase, bacterial